MSKVAIVGAGLIGRAWAMVFARAGWTVSLTDPAPGALDVALEGCRKGLLTLAENGLCDDAAAAAARISAAASLAEALDGAAHVQENGPERDDVKAALFAEMDRLAAPETVLASSTSAIQCSLFTKELDGRHRCIVAHPVNPPHLVPVVELSGAPWTSPETVATARATFEAIGQAPITVKKEVEGFILNRLQTAVLTEAFRLVEEGYVSPRDLDTTISHGLGLRWSFMGPFQTIELNAPGGIPDYCARYSPFFRRLATEAGGPEVWDEERVKIVTDAWGPPPAPADHAAMSEWRDGRLAALAAHKASRS
ncbi:3-hydroxyacyl-CoA dehydrogenase [Acuticoccus mangrovi]|uniref:3-hydroxyacyl-CoA dehydrogenase n=1 Tax=Acuticoccus mangrovi TaxID=2796142 RepID=A0A934MI46_9HYPH|nr:3-hydroxyacyl-CoA dehydrogenase [Acuticoccus mangrovi]MBJ3777565.1 3-hydroxyacyl-CoA dehydrogenase [Acuticoccus mangrovi]